MKRILFLVSVVALAVVSCNKKDLPSVDVAAEDGLTEISFSVSEPETRATVVTSLSSVNVTATKGTAETSVFENVAFTQANGWKAGKYWPEQGAYTQNPYHFYASNAQMSLSGSNVTVTVSGVNASNALDVVCDYVATPVFQQTTTLTMHHILAQVGYIKVLAPAGCTIENLKIRLIPNYGGTYNLKNGAWTNTAAGTAFYLIGSAQSGVNITTAGGSYQSTDRDLWLIPGNYTLTAEYTIWKGDYSESFVGNTAKTTSVNIQAGYNNNIVPSTDNGGNEQPNFPDPTGAQEITFSVSVEAWQTRDAVAQF